MCPTARLLANFYRTKQSVPIAHRELDRGSSRGDVNHTNKTPLSGAKLSPKRASRCLSFGLDADLLDHWLPVDHVFLDALSQDVLDFTNLGSNPRVLQPCLEGRRRQQLGAFGCELMDDFRFPLFRIML